MDLSKDLIDVQGLLIDLDKTNGPLNKIRFKGGNESKITAVIDKIRNYLINKNYLINQKINENFDNELQKIVTFLTLNCEFNNELRLEEYSHLISITPQLSKCLLAHIVMELDFCKYYCLVIQKFPDNLTEELFFEMIGCLNKCKPRRKLKYASIFLQTIMNKTSRYKKSNEYTEDLARIASTVLLQLTVFQMEEIPTLQRIEVYEHLGYSILGLFSLLLDCEHNNVALLELLKHLFNTCSQLLEYITLDAFCYWMEIDEDDTPLQTVVAERAYFVKEKYKDNAMAERLLTLLSSVARKPKSLNQVIQSADIQKIITMVNRADENQKDWFKALISRDIDSNPDALQCISNWAHLCQKDDVSNLLDHVKNNEFKSLVVKCASVLDTPDLAYVIVRHFYKNGFHPMDIDVKPQLVILFNKLNSISDEIFTKEYLLLLLQDAKSVLTTTFEECLRNTFYTDRLVETFKIIKEIGAIHNFMVDILNEEMKKNVPCERNLLNYTALFNCFTELQILSIDVIVLKILLPYIQDVFQKSLHVELLYSLTIFKSLKEPIILKENTEIIFNELLEIIKKCRCKFFEFDRTKQEVVKLIVDYILDYTSVNYLCYETDEFKHDDDLYVSFYERQIFNRQRIPSFLKHLCPNFLLKDQGEALSNLIRILPLCVTREWLLIYSDVSMCCGDEDAIDLFVYFLILLSQLVQKQENNDNAMPTVNALRYCIQNFAIVIKYIQPKLTPNQDISVTKNICNLIKEIPNKDIKYEEGMILINLLTQQSLKTLANNKLFNKIIDSMDEPRISDVIRKRQQS